MSYTEDFSVNISETCQKKYEEESLRAYLTDRMKEDYENTSDKSKKAFLYYLLKIDITDERKFERVIFAYNDGELRSYEELAVYDKRIEHSFLYKNFNVIRHIVNMLFILTPLGLIMKKTLKVDNILLLPFGLLSSLILSYIGSLAGNTVNIHLAEKCGIDENDSAVVKEKFKRSSGIYAGIFSIFSTLNHTKKAVKDIADVDSWKELK